MYGDNPNGINRSSDFYNKFIMTGKIKASGNIQSLISKDCPDEIPCTHCYYHMFFYGYTSLTQAPELPATTLVEDCYGSMFYGCSKLNYIKVGVTSWDTSSADSWVSGVSNTGTFVKPANTSISTGIDGIPRGWTVQNI